MNIRPEIIAAYVKRTGEPEATIRSQIARCHAVHLGGRHWECVYCAGSLKAECPCCAPPSCNCDRPRRSIES